MLIIDKKILIYNTKEVHFSDSPFDIDNCDFLSFRYCKNKVDIKGFTRKNEFTMVIDLTQNLDKIWQNMDKKSVRYHINKAQREGIKIFKNEYFDIFFQIYRSFIRKKELKSLFDVFGVGSVSIDSMKKNGTLFVADYNGEIISGTVFLEDNSHIESWIGASKRLDLKVGKKKSLIASADRLIDWEVIKYAKEKGLKNFDFGGIWSQELAEKDIVKMGINNYKLALGGKIVPCYLYQKIYSKTFNLLNRIYDIKN